MGTFSASTVTADYGGKTYTLAVRYGVVDGNDVSLALATRGSVFTVR